MMHTHCRKILTVSMNTDRSSLHESAHGSIVDGQLDVVGQVVHLRIGLRYPLDFPTPFISVFIDNPDGVTVDTKNRCIDSILFTDLQRVANFIISEVVF